jgi:hypothetical protein
VEAAEAAARKLAIRLCSENEYHASYPEVVRVESSSRVPLVSASLTEPDPIGLKTGTQYRMRFINITNNESDLRVRLESKEVPAQWTVIAKDGAELPNLRRKASAAEMGVTVGSTCDVEYQSDRVGFAELQIFARGFEALIMQPLDFGTSK